MTLPGRKRRSDELLHHSGEIKQVRTNLSIRADKPRSLAPERKAMLTIDIEGEFAEAVVGPSQSSIMAYVHANPVIGQTEMHRHTSKVRFVLATSPSVVSRRLPWIPLMGGLRRGAVRLDVPVVDFKAKNLDLAKTIKFAKNKTCPAGIQRSLTSAKAATIECNCAGGD